MTLFETYRTPYKYKDILVVKCKPDNLCFASTSSNFIWGEANWINYHRILKEDNQCTY